MEKVERGCFVGDDGRQVLLISKWTFKVFYYILFVVTGWKSEKGLGRKKEEVLGGAID